MNKRAIAYALALVICYFIFRYITTEGYKPLRGDYVNDKIDTNPKRRVSQFFDKCSPENMSECSLNNPYEGLPLP
jgi:hypothetical protein